MRIEHMSSLERDILEHLWSRKRLKVRQLYDLLKQKRKVALTTIAVALDRLHSKGMVSRIVEKGRGGLRYIYFPKKTQQEVEQSLIDKAVNQLIDAFGQTAITYFNERFKKR